MMEEIIPQEKTYNFERLFRQSGTYLIVFRQSVSQWTKCIIITSDLQQMIAQEDK